MSAVTERHQTSTGVRVVFPKNWPHLRDHFDEFLPNGKRNPLFKLRSDTPRFAPDHFLAVNHKNLGAHFLKDPKDPRYKDEGRLWVVNGKCFHTDPAQIKKDENDESLTV